jgi:hypothetical protein
MNKQIIILYVQEERVMTLKDILEAAAENAENNNPYRN